MTTRFVICATQRSGSTMVCEDFANQLGLGNPNEYFVKALDRHREDGSKTALDDIMSEGRDESGNEAVKVMASYLGAIETVLSDGDRANSSVFPAFHEAFANANWVRIVRLERDRQALSRIMASKSGIYHLLGGKTLLKIGDMVHDRSKVESATQIDYCEDISDAMLAEIGKIAKEELIWDRFFSHWSIKPLELVYEEVAAAKHNYLLPLQDAIDTTLPAELPQRSIRRISGKSSEAIIEAFREEFGGPSIG